MKTKATCCVAGCNKTASRKMMCDTHYLRNWRNGSPDVVRRVASRTVNVDGEEKRLCAVCNTALRTSFFHRKKNGFSASCKECRKLETQDIEKKKLAGEAWRAANKDAIAEKKKRGYESLRDTLRSEWLEAYGGKCECCGEGNWKFLTIEHVNGDGKHHREQVGTGASMLKSIKQEGWPRDKYQMLCFNCNSGKSRNGGICPHKEPCTT